MGKNAIGARTLNAAAIGLFTLGVIYAASAFKSQEQELAQANNMEEEQVATLQAVSARQIIEEAEEKRRLELDKKTEEAIRDAKRLKKEQSPECKFWTLQKQKGSSDKADEKIAQYCLL